VRRFAVFALFGLALATLAIAAGNLGIPPVVITREGEQKLVLLFGDVRDVTQPGISLAIPFVEVIRTYPSGWLYNNTDAQGIQTQDGEQLVIDNYTVWRIQDPRLFMRAFASVQVAEQRIDRQVRDAVREVIGRHTLTQVLKEQRTEIMQEVTSNARSALESLGIAIADVRINRSELPPGTEESVYARMKTERERLAKKNRAEGDERARRIRAEADRDARVIVANARRDSEITRGVGDAEAARIYGAAYSAEPDFYSFVRSLEAYRKAIDGKTTLVLSPDTEFFKYLEELGRE
jgi:modulator of FtsH protease HflC